MVSGRLLDVSEGLQRQKSVCDRTVPFFITDMRKRKNKLVLSVFCREIEFMDVIEESAKTNQIFWMDGYICKEYGLPENSSWQRNCGFTCLRSTDPMEKSDYIPCICWGRNARYVSSLP